MPDKKMGCNGSIYPRTQTEEQYVHTYGQTVYLQYQTTRTTSLANPSIQTMPPGTLSTDLLLRIQCIPGEDLRLIPMDSNLAAISFYTLIGVKKGDQRRGWTSARGVW